ncbi:hypothetical protein J6590_068496 [Homalodisca vitripennis]|nr:hypothetical protein J6590_068496 [Homalodisca vitripennis]
MVMLLSFNADLLCKPNPPEVLFQIVPIFRSVRVRGEGTHTQTAMEVEPSYSHHSHYHRRGRGYPVLFYPSSGAPAAPPPRQPDSDDSPMVGVCVQQSPVASH